MNTKKIMQKYKYEEEIYKEDFINSLIYEMDFSYSEAKFVLEYINNTYKHKNLNKELINMLNKKMKNIPQSDLNEFLEFLLSLSNKIFINKKISNIIEETMLNMIDNLLKETSYKLTYMVQAKTIIEIMTKIFKWEEKNFDDFKSSKEIQDYILKNMEIVYNSYSNLTNKLLKIFENNKFVYDDMDYSFLYEKDSVISRMYNSI